MTIARYRIVTLVSTALLGAIIVTGSAVRLTGSGLGCSDWPTCEDNQLVADFGYHGWIEYGNRLVTGAVSVVVILAVLGAHRLSPRRPDLVRWAWGLVAGVAAQIVLGALVVRLHLEPRLVIGHFLLSLVLLWNALVLQHRARGRHEGPMPVPISRGLVWLQSGLLGVVTVAGTIVTASGPHTGSLDEPIERLPFDISTVTRIHSASAISLAVAAVLVRRRLAALDASPGLRRHSTVVLGIIAAQATVGWIQYFTGVPVGLVALHIFGVVCLWSAIVSLHLRLERPRVPDSATPDEIPTLSPTG